MSATAGPSKSRKGKKATTTKVKTGKVKKITEKQKIDGLEENATNFIPSSTLKAFADLPISEPTKRGLKKAFFLDMTDIQTKSLPVSLKGKDVLGAARTGSGKTLAFLVPVLEMLYRKKWGAADGLGALIISPTRELAVQIFEVLRSIGGYHMFSAGLVIGGKNLKDEADRLAKMNILVATPGRLLQHMDQTVGFESDNLQVLVLDEADRILDMGFAKTLSALLAHLPKSRQTLLFSATQTDSVSDLARLSLHDPVYVGVQEPSATTTNTTGDATTTTTSSTPQNLEQHYLLCTLDKKLDILWSFIKSHLQSKILVFLSSCKQVRFIFETFCKMHPGVSLLQLHGKQKQTARLAAYGKFSAASHAVLFATDIAARGLDFPSVGWVLQVDAPEDADTYIHRVGRTARYESKGKGLLFLMPSEEEGMQTVLKAKGIEIKMIKVKNSKTQSIEKQLQKLAFQEPDIKYLGQRAFVSYLRSVHLHKDKSIFKVEELPADRFAESLGLPGAPKIKFLSKEMAKKKKNASRYVAEAQAEAAAEKNEDALVAGDDDDSEDDDDDGDGDDQDDEGGAASSSEEEETKLTDEDQPLRKKPAPAVRTKYDRMFERKNQNILSEHYTKLISHSDAEDSGDDPDDFITLKRANHELDNTGVFKVDPEDISRRKLKMGKAARALVTGGSAKRTVFDDEGKAHEVYEMVDPEAWFEEKGGIGGAMAEGRRFAVEERGRMDGADEVDREEAKDKKREKKRKRKEREKNAGGSDSEGDSRNSRPTVFLARPTTHDDADDDGYESPEFDLPVRGSDSESDGSTFDPAPPPAKRSKISNGPKPIATLPKRDAATATMEDDEEMALQLLRHW